MSTTSATSAAAAYLLQGQPGATGAPQGATTQQAEAQQAQPKVGAAEAKPEPFNAPMLVLPEEPSTVDVMNGLRGSMADPTTNASSAQRLYEFHQQMMEAHKTMVQVILDGIVSR